MRSIIKAFLFLIFLLSATNIFAQQLLNDTAGKKEINILKADRLNYKKENDSTVFQSLAGNVIVKQENTTFYCDSAVLNRSANTLEAFGHVHINDADSIHTYSDYLKYLGREKKAHLNGNVRLTDGKGVLTTPQLDYDVQNKIGTYTKNGKLVNGTTVLTSGEGFYYGETRDVVFKKNVVLIDTNYTVKTDTLLYNTYTGITTFVVPTVITSGAQKIITSNGYYDTKNKKQYFGKRPIIQDSTTTLIADEVANNDSTGFGEARGNVIYRDTAQGVSILADNLKSNRKQNSFLATIHPVMIIKQEQDSIFIAADTLFSGRLSDMDTSRHYTPLDTLAKIDSLTNKPDSSTDRYIEAYYNVRIYSDSLQAVGDSLFYSGQDSVFRLFNNPVVWSQQSQITGDTIYLYTQNKKPKRLYVFENALTINQVDSTDFFNQLKGRTINGYFTNGNINYIRASGNAESVYYGQDDNHKFLGVNQSTSDIIDMFFEDKKPQKIVSRNNLQGTFYPMRQVNHEELKLRGFEWLEERRPKSKEELLSSSER
ncbi:MAG: OstA-like protein [Ilyomonas sp.]